MATVKELDQRLAQLEKAAKTAQIQKLQDSCLHGAIGTRIDSDGYIGDGKCVY